MLGLGIFGDVEFLLSVLVKMGYYIIEGLILAKVVKVTVTSGFMGVVSGFVAKAVTVLV